MQQLVSNNAMYTCRSVVPFKCTSLHRLAIDTQQMGTKQMKIQNIFMA